MNREIVIITTGQPSTNPRMVKEYLALKSAGYQVKVLYCYWTSWATYTDQEFFNKGILDEKDFKLTGGSPTYEKFKYFFSKIIYKFSSILASEFLLFSEYSVSRAVFYLNKAAKKEKANLYIAHNLGAIKAAISGAKKNNGKATIDFEDYYRGQWEENSKGYKLSRLIENKYLPDVSFSTAASPMIAEKYKEVYPYLNPVTINNVFSKNYLQKKITEYKQEDELKLFWFSQTVGKGRGLEELIKAIGKINKKISCTILGECDIQMKDYFLQIIKESRISESQINFVAPVSLEKIFSIASEHHIGLAIETEPTINREICLTNKIFIYLLSGLAIIATNTLAQKQFLETYGEVGNFYQKGDVSSLSQYISLYLEMPELLNQHRYNALKLAADELNWEKESKKFLTAIASSLPET